MNKERLDVVMGIISQMERRFDKTTTKKLQLEKWRRVANKLNFFGKECEECRQQFTVLENHLNQLNSGGNIVEPSKIKEYTIKLKSLLSHLEKKHKVISDGYYLSIYMSIGMSFGVVFGLTLFDNIALGIPIGFSVGLAIGAGLDADAKKKGLVI
ncbi:MULTISPECIES: hypothetical protein [Bacillaceae]|nr:MULTISPECIES: hypothetical protein [Bacillaceae]